MNPPPPEPVNAQAPPAGEGIDPPPPTRGLARKIIAATLLGVLVFAALSLYGDVAALRRNLAALEVRYVFAGLALATANYAIRFVRWEYYLRRVTSPDERPPLGESLRIFLAGFVMSVTPGKVGEVFKSWLLLESRNIAIARTAPIVIAERLTDLMALVALVAVGGMAFPRGRAVAFVAGGVVLAIWLLCAVRPVGHAALKLLGRIPALDGVTPKLSEAYESLSDPVRPGALVAMTALSTVSWFLECLCVLVIARGFGVDLDVVGATFAYAAPTIVGALAMLPGGLGVTEAGMTGALMTVSTEMTPAIATALTMLVRLVTLWWAVVLGLFALLLHRRLARHAPAVSPTFAARAGTSAHPEPGE